MQLWLGLHNVKMEIHRRLGLVYLAAVAIGSVAAFGLALKTDGGAIFGSGLFFLGVAWLTTTGLAYVAVKKYLIDQHREWMIRSYVVTFAFVTFRAGQVALVGRGVDLPTAIGIMALGVLGDSAAGDGTDPPGAEDRRSCAPRLGALRASVAT